MSQNHANGDCWLLLQAEKEKLQTECNKFEALEALLIKHGILSLSSLDPLI
ncbi:hypothetical protein [Pontibacter pamirensis]|uniref:hypothetical protein n=1 Tax=Pontibacter pamirensis TaxID=2562824 RepID=UPI0013897F1E|nr:hypothetical protein [Pontibacter pamirensis]